MQHVFHVLQCVWRTGGGLNGLFICSCASASQRVKLYAALLYKTAIYFTIQSDGAATNAPI